MPKKKYIRPEKRMKKYSHFGVKPPKYDVSKVDWTRFIIVVPSAADKKEVQAALEYLHYRDIDTGFVTVNQIVHEYDHGDNFTRIIVDPKTYKNLRVRLKISAKE